MLSRGSIGRLFGRIVHDPDLWHINRRSVAGAVAIGLFVAFVPLPFQMVIAAAAAIAFGCNLAIAVVLVWVSNPLTMGPLFFGAYKAGAWLLGVPPEPLRFEMSLDWLMRRLGEVWEPFLLGCFLVGAAAALLGYLAVRLAWRLHVLAAWRRRRARGGRGRTNSTL